MPEDVLRWLRPPLHRLNYCAATWRIMASITRGERANAIFALDGKPVRALPLSAQGLTFA